MKLSALAVCACGFLGLVVPVHADWQFTTWGMTAEDVVSESSQQAVPPPHEEVKGIPLKGSGLLPALRMRWTSGSFVLYAYFYFDGPERGLSQVRLYLDKGDPYELLHAMRAKYGQPDRESNDQDGVRMVMASWRTATDTIEYLLIGDDYVTLDYYPRESEDTSGL